MSWKTEQYKAMKALMTLAGYIILYCRRFLPFTIKFMQNQTFANSYPSATRFQFFQTKCHKELSHQQQIVNLRSCYLNDPAQGIDKTTNTWMSN